MFVSNNVKTIVHINTARSALVTPNTILVKNNTELNLGPNLSKYFKPLPEQQ